MTFLDSVVIITMTMGAGAKILVRFQFVAASKNESHLERDQINQINYVYRHFSYLYIKAIGVAKAKASLG